MDKIYSVQELSKILNLCELTIRQYIKHNKIHAFKVGRQWRISEKELNSFYFDLITSNKI